MRRLAIVTGAGLIVGALSGCATIIKGTSQSIAITTPPTSGAECTLSSREGNWVVISPGVATVEKSKEDILARCIKPGWQDGVATIPSDFQGWTLGNFVAGGLLGFGVDAATGAINDYPHAFQIPMMPGISSASVPSPTPAAAPLPALGASNASTSTATLTEGLTAYKRGDYDNALALLRPLADQGNPTAQDAIGHAYENGHGVTKDPSQAYQWWRKAASQGSPEAKTNLGWLYEHGSGVDQSNIRAYMWYLLAAGEKKGDGEKPPNTDRDRVAGTLSPTEISMATELANECKDTHFDQCGWVGPKPR